MKKDAWKFSKDASFSIVSEFNLVCEKSYLAALTSSSLSEIVEAKHRVLVGSFYNIPFTLSYLALTLLAYYVDHWRKIVFYTSSPVFSVVIMTFMLPETARWLYATGKTEKAEQLIIKIAKLNQKKT